MKNFLESIRIRSKKDPIRRNSKNRLLDDAVYIQKTLGFAERYVHSKITSAIDKSYGERLSMDRLGVIWEELKHMPPELNFKYKILFRIVESDYGPQMDFVVQHNYMSKGEKKQTHVGLFGSEFSYEDYQDAEGRFDYEKLFEMVKFVEYFHKKDDGNGFGRGTHNSHIRK